MAASAKSVSSPVRFSRTSLDYSSKLTIAQEAQFYRVLVLRPGEGRVVRRLRAANPKLIVLMDVNPTYAAPADTPAAQTCTTYAHIDAIPAHRALHSSTGQVLHAQGGVLMDLGNAGYRRTCIQNAVRVARANDFNGVMLSGLTASSPSAIPANTRVEGYLTRGSWASASHSFLIDAAQMIHADHLKVMANLSAVAASPGLWRSWTAPLDGSEQQGWTVNDHGARAQLPHWTPELGEVAWSEAHHKYAILDSDSQTDAGNTYGLASMLLVADGYSSYATDNGRTAGSEENFYTQYDTATKLGAATGRDHHLADRLYARAFQNGVVIVNPTLRTIRLSGVTIAPTSGVIALSSPTSPLSGPTSTFSPSSGSSSSGTTGSKGTAGSKSTAGSKGATTTSAAPSPVLGPSPALFNRTAYEYSSQYSYAQEASQYQFMILTSLDASDVAALHAANPNLKILMYSMALYSVSTDPNGNEACTSYTSDNANDPSWFLQDQNGNRMSVHNNWVMDMGNSGYQQACVAHTIAQAKQDGFDGVFFDGLNAYWQGFVPSGSTVVAYPSKPSWQAAMQSFLNYAGQTVQANGLLAFANLGGTSSQLWDQWTTPLNGSQEQGFTDGGEGLAQQVPYWQLNLTNDAWNEAHDKYAIEDSYNKTEAGNTYGLASMLLVANGYSSWSTSNSDDTASYEQWYPEYSDAQQLGSPTGAYTQLSNGVYERKFQNGIVLSNPTTTAVGTFSLGGTYQGATTPATSTVSLPATSGLILLKAS